MNNGKQSNGAALPRGILRRAGNIIGNEDLAVLYSASVMAGGAQELVAKHRAALDAPRKVRQQYTATRKRFRKPGNDAITVEALTLDEAIDAMRRIAHQYFQPGKVWLVGNLSVEL